MISMNSVTNQTIVTNWHDSLWRSANLIDDSDRIHLHIQLHDSARELLGSGGNGTVAHHIVCLGFGPLVDGQHIPFHTQPNHYRDSALCHWDYAFSDFVAFHTNQETRKLYQELWKTFLNRF